MERLTLTVEYLFNTAEERAIFFEREVEPRLCFKGGNIETYSLAPVFDELYELRMKAE